MYPAARATVPTVVVGGPGFVGTPNNHFALEILRARQLELSYTPGEVSFRGRTWHWDVDGERLRADVGVFARLQSPLDENVTLILLQGLQTRGVFGALRAFGLSETAAPNHKLVRRIAGDCDFVAVFRVPVVAGGASIPRLSADDIFVV